MAELAINNYDLATTGVSSFFLLHRYNLEPLQLLDKDLHSKRSLHSLIQQANNIVQKLKEAAK